MPNIRHRIGTLRHKVVIQENTGTTRNGYNEITADWTTLTAGDSVHARVEALRGSELVEAQQLHANVTHKITARWIDGVTPQMRVSHDSRVFNIEAVLNVDDRDWIMELLATEAV